MSNENEFVLRLANEMIQLIERERDKLRDEITRLNSELTSFKPAFFIDPIEIPLVYDANTIYCTASNFDGCTLQVYIKERKEEEKREEEKEEKNPIEPKEVYSPHTILLKTD